MSQDSSSHNSTKANEVNLDELEVEILVLCKNPSALNSAAAFLTRRGWPTTVMTNLSKAVEHIAEKKPDFVLVSFSHPNPAVFKLPDLITQTFNLSCIGFVETLDTASQNRLNNFKIRHKIQGSPSGPNLQRSIRKILADKFNIKTEHTPHERTDRKSDDGSVVTVKGSAPIETGGNVVQSSAKGPGGADHTAGSSQRVGSSHESASSKSGNIGYMPQHDQGPNGPASHGANASGSQKSNGFAYMPETSPSHDPANPPPSSVPDEVLSTGKYTMSKKGRKSLKDLSQGQSEGGDERPTESLASLKKSLFGETGPETETAGTSLATSTPSREESSEGPEVLSAEALAQLPPVSLLERAVHLGLRRVCVDVASEDFHPLNQLTKVAVFPMESSANLAGYLVVGVEQSPNKIEELFLKQCEGSFLEQFSALKVPARLERGFWVHVPTVDFTEWVASKAEFQIILPHESSEVGVAFFPVGGSLPKAHGAEDGKMLAINIDEISTEQPVNFKAYLHLKKNKKYFLYLRNGRHLQPEQKQRLKGRQVKDIFMKTVDAENLKMFLAASFLRDSIKNAA